MSLHHYPRTMYKYRKANNKDKKEGGCPFCKPAQYERAVKTTDTMYVIPNRLKYDLFEGVPVTDHLMVIPKKHRESLTEFTNKERDEMFKLSAEYEAKGYHVFARGTGAITRSVAHQHTHLIKLSTKSTRVIFYVSKIGALIAK